MELKDFIEKVLGDIVTSVDNASKNLSRKVWLNPSNDSRVIEFDVAVTAEEIMGGSTQAKGSVKVMSLIGMDAEGQVKAEVKNSSVSRVRFGVHVSHQTKEQEANTMHSIASPLNKSVY
jgi:hypothetical protein